MEKVKWMNKFREINEAYLVAKGIGYYHLLFIPPNKDKADSCGAIVICKLEENQCYACDDDDIFVNLSDEDAKTWMSRVNWMSRAKMFVAKRICKKDNQ